MDEYVIDVDSLKSDLKNYFGTAMISVNMIAMMDLINVDNASDEELINLAIKNGFDLNNYVVDKKNKSK